jgi:hypothetical protein
MFQFQLIKTTWGIFIELEGTLEFEGPVPDQPSIADGIYFVVPEKLLRKEELKQADHAILRHKSTLDLRRRCGSAVITLTSFSYSPTDFQLEGVDAAVTSWLSEVLSTPNPWLSGSFNKESYRYDFEFIDGTVLGSTTKWWLTEA